MLNLFLNILGLGLFVLVLLGVFWLSAIIAVILLCVFFAAFVGMKIWRYLLQKRIVNPRPGHPMEEGVIDAEFTRVDTTIEEKKR